MNNINTLKQANPEVLEIFRSSYPDDDMTIAELDKKTSAINALAVNIGLGSTTNFYTAVQEALRAGVHPKEIQEIVYQCAPILGFAKTFGFVEVMNTVFEEECIGLDLKNASSVSKSEEFDQTLSLVEELFNTYMREISEGIIDEGADFSSWLDEYGYTDLLSESSLDMKTREMIVFCVLYTMGAAAEALKTHAGVNMNLGNDREFLICLLEASLPNVGLAKSNMALEAVNNAADEYML